MLKIMFIRYKPLVTKLFVLSYKGTHPLEEKEEQFGQSFRNFSHSRRSSIKQHP